MQLVQSGTETVLGSTGGSLQPFQTTRLLDVFSVAGLAGDFSDVRATFSTADAGQPAFVGACTVETSSNGSADFRIAKAMTPPPSGGGAPGTPTATWNGSIQTLLGGDALEFAGPTAPITLAATETVSAYGGGWFGTQSVGTGTVSVGVCYQNQSGPGPVTLLGSTSSSPVPSTGSAVTFASGSGSAALAAGTYNVGLCAQNFGSNSLNLNNHSSGFVFVTP